MTNSDRGSSTRGESRVMMKADTGVMPPQAMEQQRWGATPHKWGDRHGTESLTASEGTHTAHTLNLDSGPAER